RGLQAPPHRAPPLAAPGQQLLTLLGRRLLLLGLVLRASSFEGAHLFVRGRATEGLVHGALVLLELAVGRAVCVGFRGGAPGRIQARRVALLALPALSAPLSLLALLTAPLQRPRRPFLGQV